MGRWSELAEKRLSAREEARFGASIAGVLPMPIVMVDASDRLVYANQAAEQFFDMGVQLLLKQTLAELLPFGSPLLQLVQQTRERGASVAERNVDLSTP